MNHRVDAQSKFAQPRFALADVKGRKHLGVTINGHVLATRGGDVTTAVDQVGTATPTIRYWLQSSGFDFSSETISVIAFRVMMVVGARTDDHSRGCGSARGPRWTPRRHNTSWARNCQPLVRPIFHPMPRALFHGLASKDGQTRLLNISDLECARPTEPGVSEGPLVTGSTQ